MEENSICRWSRRRCRDARSYVSVGTIKSPAEAANSAPDASHSESETKRLHIDRATRDVVMLLNDFDVCRAVGWCREVCRQRKTFLVGVNDWNCEFRDRATRLWLSWWDCCGRLVLGLNCENPWRNCTKNLSITSWKMKLMDKEGQK